MNANDDGMPSGGTATRLPDAGVPVTGPSGLSDYAVSPLGTSAALLQGEVRVAFLGRTSTEEQQDPRQSLVRQLGNSKAALPAAWMIVNHFYDVESGRMELDARGKGSNYERHNIPIARDGGIADLLAAAHRPDRTFDVVICENVARVSRRTYEGISIERELERADVPLFASNEPITLTGSRAQRILQRRINQSVAEYEVLNTLEQSWGGLCTHVREGWNIGIPPHGYRAKKFRHPNPTKAARGQTKSRLEPDGTKGETVTQAAHWRYYEKLGYDTIADRLNAEPEQHPTPVPPDPSRARGAWSKSNVRDMLLNPKYTGYQVFNRRASRSGRGKVNDHAKWVWSPEPVHEPLIPKWMYDAIVAMHDVRKGSRDSDSANSHPATRRTYLFRGCIFCPCGRRLNGNQRRKGAYYVCHPRTNNRGRDDKIKDHPKRVYVNERELLNVIGQFYADRVFGPQRRHLLLRDLDAVDHRAERAHQRERERLQRSLADVARRQEAVLRQVQNGDPDDPFASALRSTYNDLEKEKNATLKAVEHLDNAAPEPPPTGGDIAVLDALPHLTANLAAAPQPLLRRLFDATQLAIRIDNETDDIRIDIMLNEHSVTEVVDTARLVNGHSSPIPSPNTCAPRPARTNPAHGVLRLSTSRHLPRNRRPDGASREG